MPQTQATTTRTELRAIYVEDLGKDAIILRRYGLVLVDTRAATLRPGAIDAWIKSAG